MQPLNFSLCSRCKKCIPGGKNITIGPATIGVLCKECEAPMEQLIEEELNKISIPKTLLPYLPKKML